MKTINELMNLEGRKVIVTGATGSLGKIIAETICELGGELILVDQPKSNFSTMISDLNKKYASNISFFDCNLEDKNARNNLIKSINKEHSSGISALINNAAFVGQSDLPGWTTKFEEQSVETWSRAMEVNLTAAFDLCKGFSSSLNKSCNGSIINISSIYGFAGPVMSMYEGTEMGNPAAYAASKGGLIQLTRWLSTTLAPNVRVNSISPGGIWRNQPVDFVKRYESRTPLGRMAREEDFKGIIAYLSSDLSAYVTGQNIVIDGGWTV